MKKQIKKLSLNKKTISNLSSAEMETNIGGFGKTKGHTCAFSCAYTCMLQNCGRTNLYNCLG
jgi:natural product precursor